MAKFLVLLSTLLMLVTFGQVSPAAPRKHTPPCSIHYPTDDQVEWECRRLAKGTLESLFGERWQDVLRFNRIDRRHLYPGSRLKIPVNLEEIKDFTPLPQSYTPAETEPRFILIDLSEQFLGAYEFGRLVFSFPIASGDRKHKTPVGKFRIDAYNRNHQSSLYFIEKTHIPYPMHYALRFYVNKRRNVAFWIHGRDLPGYPASHGCVGMYDEEMQKEYYRNPQEPVLMAAKTLFEWAIAPNENDGRFNLLRNGPLVLIIGVPPV
jgi:hypothetical protein